MVSSKHAISVVAVVIVVLLQFGSIANVDGLQVGNQDIVMTDMNIRATLETDCDTSLILESVVQNFGISVKDYFDIRIDVRSIGVSTALLNGTVAEVTIIPESNYMIVRIFPAVPLAPDTSVTLFLNLTTQCLQEQVGLNEDQTMYLNHLIYYIRPINEIHNLTFTAVLPAHAILQEGVSAPLFPNPSMNYTDGQHTIFVWFSEQLLPGQEVAYIVKYGIPAAVMGLPEPPPINAMQLIPIGLLFLVIGGVAVLFVERIPAIIMRLKSRTIIKPVRLSKQEEEILSFLTKRGGSCSQREIYEELDMSQSLASTILTSLEERKLIRRFREGRENMVHIMEEM
ncbi:MAG: helix-turn-helix transcriptional regulator [Candidatus Thorarchaeota archaeon]